MGVILEDVDITGLVADDYFGVPILTETQVASDGSFIVFNKNLLYNKITLQGGSDWGWLTNETLRSIQTMAKIIGATYTLNYEGVITIVRFRTEDIPVIEGTRLLDTSLTYDETYYNNIAIKLMEV